MLLLAELYCRYKIKVMYFILLFDNHSIYFQPQFSFVIMVICSLYLSPITVEDMAPVSKLLISASCEHQKSKGDDSDAFCPGCEWLLFTSIEQKTVVTKYEIRVPLWQFAFHPFFMLLVNCSIWFDNKDFSLRLFDFCMHKQTPEVICLIWGFSCSWVYCIKENIVLLVKP